MQQLTSRADQGSAITVDYAALRGLAADLRSLAQQVTNRSLIVQSDLDHDLFGRLTSVENDWSTHRRKLQSFLSDTAQTVDDIVAQYEKTDDMIAAATS